METPRDLARIQRPMTQWAKNRVREHGNLFSVDQAGMFRGTPAHLLSCLSCEWRGWFTKDETTIEIVDSIERGRWN